MSQSVKSKNKSLSRGQSVKRTPSTLLGAVERPSSILLAALIIASVAIGVFVILRSQAAVTVLGSVQPELGTLSQATRVVDPSASGGAYVKFAATGTGVTQRFPGDPNPRVSGKTYWGASGQNIPAHEAASGKSVAIHRTFGNATSDISAGGKLIRYVREDHAANRLPWVSVGAGAWRDVANGAKDTEIDQFLRTIDSDSKPVWLTFNHEPENDPASSGTSADWRAMQSHIRARLTALGTHNIAFMSILMSYTFKPGSGRNPADWFVPGIWDTYGIDVYQHNVVGGMFDTPWNDIVAFAQSKNLPIAIGEWGNQGNDASAAQEMKDFLDINFRNNTDVVDYSYFDSGLNSGTLTWVMAGSKLATYDDILRNDPRVMRIDSLGSTNVPTVTASVNIASADRYTVWSRLQTAVGSNSYGLKIDKGTTVTVGGGAPATAWTWVSAPASVNLVAGAHSVQLTGMGAGVKIDRLLFVAGACVPTGTGDNCSGGPTPSSPPSTTPLPSGSPSPTPTIIPSPPPVPGNSIELVSPPGGATLRGFVTVKAKLSLQAAKSSESVVLLYDGKFIARQSAQAGVTSYNFLWNTLDVPNGAHSLRVSARNSLNGKIDTDAHEVTVKSSNCIGFWFLSPQSICF